MNQKFIPNAPLFSDPIFDGAADPVIIWNHLEKAWWICYTNRRATEFSVGFSYFHGTDIGVISSSDNGQTWLYRGVLQGLEFENGRNTFWAPEIIYNNGLYHMYCSYVRGIPADWYWERHIVHYTSRNLWDWHYESILNLSSDKVIDACVYEINMGEWKMWYKDETNQNTTYAAVSNDLYHWEVVGVEITDRPHEGPNVFEFKGNKWLITDHWNGLGIYKSKDYKTWEWQIDILNEPGKRVEDTDLGHHADILVCGERAYIFYFVHPGLSKEFIKCKNAHWEYCHRRSVLQVAELKFDGISLLCDRDEDFYMIIEHNDVI